MVFTCLEMTLYSTLGCNSLMFSLSTNYTSGVRTALIALDTHEVKAAPLLGARCMVR